MSDELWEEIETYIPKKQRDPNNHYQKVPGQGRPGLPTRQVLEGIFYVLLYPANWMPVESCSAGIRVQIAVFNGIFKNGKQRVSLKRYGFGLRGYSESFKK